MHLRCGSGAGLVHPLAVGPAPHILARCDDRAAHLADLARSVSLAVAAQGAVGVLMAHDPAFFRRSAQVLLRPLFNFSPAEIRWGCHVCLPEVRWAGVTRRRLPASHPPWSSGRWRSRPLTVPESHRGMPFVSRPELELHGRAVRG